MSGSLMPAASTSAASAVVPGDGRVAPAGCVVELVGQRVARRAARIAGDHDEVARAQRLVGELQPVLGLVRHVVLGRSEEHTSELQSLMRISYAVFCLKKKKKTTQTKR